MVRPRRGSAWSLISRLQYWWTGTRDYLRRAAVLPVLAGSLELGKLTDVCCKYVRCSLPGTAPCVLAGHRAPHRDIWVDSGGFSHPTSGRVTPAHTLASTECLFFVSTRKYYYRQDILLSNLLHNTCKAYDR